MSESEKSLVPVERPSNRLPALLSPSGQDDFWSSLNPKNPDELALMFASRLGEVDRLSEAINLTLEVKHLMMHHATIKTKEGELVECVRVVLITPEGDCYGCVSQGVIDCLRFICQGKGMPPWVPAQKLTVKQRELKNGHRMFQLIPAGATPASNGTGGR